MFQGFRSEVDRLQEKIVRFTKDLIRIPSPSLHEDRVAVRVREEMQRLDFDLSFTDEVGNVIGVIAGGDPKCTLLLNSHMDTDGSGGLGSWSGYPLGGEVNGDHIVGLGAPDCKAGIATHVYAAHLFAQSTVERRANFVVAATVAEEDGCSLGVRHLLKTTLPRIGAEPKLCILGEPTGLEVCFGHDGWVRVDVDLLSTNPEAVGCAAEIVHRVLQFHSDSGGKKRAHAVMALEEPITKIMNSGWRSRIRVLRRLFPGETPENILRWLRQLTVFETRVMQDVLVDVHLHEENQTTYTGQSRIVTTITQPWSTDLTNPLVNRARESLLSAGFTWNPRRWSLDRLGMGTAGGVLTVDHGVSTIGFGPCEDYSTNESVSKLADATFGSAVLMHGFNTAVTVIPQEVKTDMLEVSHGQPVN